MSPQPSRRQAWINYSALAGLCAAFALLWNVYRDLDRDRIAMLEQVAKLQSQVASMHEIEEQRHDGVDKQLADINKRIDIHRADIATLQQQIMNGGTRIR